MVPTAHSCKAPGIKSLDGSAPLTPLGSEPAEIFSNNPSSQPRAASETSRSTTSHVIFPAST